jgi:uncharacterized Ntn-hydrolase superfamily protein
MGTFSIVGFDPETEELGVAVQSKFLAVGALVPWARAKVGAIATQAFANTSYGPRGLQLLAEGFSAEEVLERLVSEDADRDQRQVGIVDGRGRSAAFTGKACFDYAGHITGPGFACQGNILVSRATLEAMAETFQDEKGPLSHRLIAALAAAQQAGGDRRGQQSAALIIVKEKGGYGGFSDRYIDLRVDDHEQPIQELKRLLSMHELYFRRSTESDLLSVDERLARRIQTMLKELGFYKSSMTGKFDEQTKESLKAFCLIENLEEHLRQDDRIDKRVIEFMQQKIAEKKQGRGII